MHNGNQIYRVTAIDTTTDAGQSPTHTGIREIITKSDGFAYEFIGQPFSNTNYTYGYSQPLKYVGYLNAGIW